jgi:uncharacterized protein (TIGR02145 family)
MNKYFFTFMALALMSASVLRAQSKVRLITPDGKATAIEALTADQRNAAQSLFVPGDKVFNRTSQQVEIWTGTTWEDICWKPDAPDVESPQTFCSTENPTLSSLGVSNDLAGYNIVWYDDAGEVLGSDAALPVGNYTYSVSRTLQDIESAKTSVEITVTSCVTVPAPTCSPTVPDVTFVSYNLGANPAYDTPKKQMKYLTETNYPHNGVDNVIADATVYGGLYQWGRKDLEHGASADYKRYGEGENVWKYTTGNPTPIDGNGQPIGDDVAGKFIYGNDMNSNNRNWYPNYDANKDAADALWGNGVLIDTPTDPDGILADNGKYYQNPVKTVNDPCPDGFRIPTQDEWERLVIYDCKKPYAINDNWIKLQSGKASYVPADNSAVTWVKVKDGKADTGTGLWGAGDRTGFAVYKTADWTSAAEGYRDGTSSLYADTAPEPLLFLPTAGFRSIASAKNESENGKMGYYWSSTARRTPTVAARILFISNTAGNPDNTQIVDPGMAGSRNLGFSIRCVKE